MDVGQYLDIFIDESNEHIQALSDNIMILEKEPENKDVINEIFRAAHSLKGMAGTMGFKKMQHLTHDMEDVFSEIRNDTVKVNSNLIDILFDCLDAIEAYVDNIKQTSNEGDEENAALIKRLNDYLAEAKGEKTAEEAAPAPAADEQKEAASDAKDAFKQIRLEENDIATLQQAQESGLNLYGFTVHVRSDCLLKAARAFLVFKAVEDFGQILI
ncbi:MAG: Hpt domain-containing protein, partial [Candidatus Weimeria sp.]